MEDFLKGQYGERKSIQEVLEELDRTKIRRD
jgi:hypothetical protein